MKPRIVFLQQHATPYFGILALDKHLRQAGFQAEVVIDSLEKDSICAVRELNPSLIGISVLSTEHLWLIRVTKALKKILPETKIIVGGFHGMLYAKEILEETSADFVCHSEGEEVLIRVLQALDLSEPRWESIPGVAYRGNGKIHINKTALLVPYCEDAPEDRRIYYRRYPVLAQEPGRGFISTRGCPFRCSFCYNSYMREHFKGKGTFIRQKTVESFIDEITLECSHYPIKSIFFFSDLFTFDKKWLHSFLQRYKKEIRVPFACHTTANIFDEETAVLLAEAGCWAVSFGIEAGNSFIRQNILKKTVTDEEIIRCGQLLRKHGIKVQTNNMFCLPGETLADAFKTVELNIQAGARYAHSALFLPFPKTELADYCIKEGCLDENYSLKDIPPSILSVSVLDLKDKSSIVNVQRASFFFVRWPWTFQVFRGLVVVPFLNPLFKVLSYVGYFFRHKGVKRIPFWAMIRFSWRVRKAF